MFVLGGVVGKMSFQGCRFVPYTFSETKPQMVPKDLNIGFQGLALIQGQIYNPGFLFSWGILSLPEPSTPLSS